MKLARHEKGAGSACRRPQGLGLLLLRHDAVGQRTRLGVLDGELFLRREDELVAADQREIEDADGEPDEAPRTTPLKKFGSWT